MPNLPALPSVATAALLAGATFASPALAAAPAPAPANAPRYTLVQIASERGDTQAYAINDAGQVAGTLFGAIGEDGSAIGFRWSAGKFQWMTPLRAEGESFAYALNASGTLAGWAKDSEFRLHAVRGGERFSDDLGATSGGARGINARGVVVGTTVAEETSERAFQRSPSGETIDLGTLGGTHSRAFAVNDAGLVVGDAGIQGDAASHAFAWSEASGRLEDLGTLPGGRHSHAYAVNAAGLVVGASEDGSHQFQPVRYANGKVERIGAQGGRAYGVNAHGDVVGSWGGCRAFVALAGEEPIELKSLVGNAEGWEFWEARGINDAGQIVGWGIHEGGMRGFLLEPRDGAGGAGDGTAALAGGTLRFRAQPAVTDGSSLLAFGLPLPAAGRITLFTVAGRQVRSLEAPLAATGVEWDGRDDAGRRVSSGLFLARLEFPGVKAVTRVTVVN